MVHSEKMAGLYLLYGHYFGLQHSLKDYKLPMKKNEEKSIETRIYKEEFDSVALIKGTFWSLSGSFYYGASKGSKSHLSVGNIWLILSIPRTEPPHSWFKWQKPARNKIKEILKIDRWYSFLSLTNFDYETHPFTGNAERCFGVKSHNIDWS